MGQGYSNVVKTLGQEMILDAAEWAPAPATLLPSQGIAAVSKQRRLTELQGLGKN